MCEREGTQHPTRSHAQLGAGTTRSDAMGSQWHVDSSRTDHTAARHASHACLVVGIGVDHTTQVSRVPHSPSRAGCAWSYSSTASPRCAARLRSHCRPRPARSSACTAAGSCWRWECTCFRWEGRGQGAGGCIGDERGRRVNAALVSTAARLDQHVSAHHASASLMHATAVRANAAVHTTRQCHAQLNSMRATHTTAPMPHVSQHVSATHTTMCHHVRATHTTASVPHESQHISATHTTTHHTSHAHNRTSTTRVTTHQCRASHSMRATHTTVPVPHVPVPTH